MLRQLSALVLLVVLSAFAVARWRDRTADDRLRITFFDVGQGDSALVEFPGGASWLVDSGGGFGDYEIAQRELIPELARLGILRLEVAFLTHPDQDHAYGWRSLLRELAIGELWMSREVRDSGNHLLGELLGIARDRKVPVRAFAAPWRARVHGVDAAVIPLAGEASNDRALLLRLQYGECSAFFAADAEAGAERAALGIGVPRVDLLKVGHHGSKTSSTEPFLRALRPHWAVISVGVRNRYRHPSPSVLHRLRRDGARVWRTDFHGYVRFTFRKDGTMACDSAAGDCGVGRCGPRP